ncbi:hypothetical protein ANO11243_003970 [Dothideomycetidae sp. 11243]|nr:hypothetical protein ANO11243_003970 [fungal sp. No.11243]
MRGLSLNDLPDEVLLEVVRYLDSVPLSKSQVWCSSANAIRGRGAPVTLLVQCTAPLTVRNELTKAIPMIWRCIFRALEPTRIVIHANHSDLLLVIGRVLTPFGEPTIPSLEDLHILELDRKQSSVVADSADHDSTDYGLAIRSGRLKSSMLHLSPWRHIGLNEGRVVGHPRLAGLWQLPFEDKESVMAYIFPRCCFQQDTQHSHRWQHLRDEMTFLDSFSLTTAHTPPSHLPTLLNSGGVHQWQFVRTLDIRLLPDPADVDIFDLPEAEQLEWWQGCIEAAVAHYISLRIDIINNFMKNDWRLRKVVCQDDGLLQQYPVYKRQFEAKACERLGWPREDPRVRWGRVWEVVASDNESQPLKFVLHD